MRTGAVAIIDVLGFKGIWQRHKASDVLQAMMDWEKMVEPYRDRRRANCVTQADPLTCARPDMRSRAMVSVGSTGIADRHGTAPNIAKPLAVKYGAPSRR